ncbi:MAG: hypothetical protein ACKVWV_17990 [Planctomycetota bacterium]
MSARASPQEPSSLGRREWLALLVLTAAALAVRCLGVDRMLPHFLEPDVFVAVHAGELRGDADLLTMVDFRERYPSLIAHVASALPRGPVPAVAPPGDDSLAVHLRAASMPYLQVRALSAVLSALLVPLTYLLARRSLSVRGACVAAALLATSLLHTTHSMQARPHGIHATLALGAVLLAERASRRAGFAPAAGACVAAAAAVATLQTGMFVLPPLCVALFVRASSWWKGLASAAAASAVVIAVAAPFYPAWIQVDAAGIRLAGSGGHRLDFSNFNGRGVSSAVGHLWAHDPVLLSTAAIGALAILIGLLRADAAALNARARERSTWIFASYALPYALVLALNEETYDRFLLPLLPYCACAAAAGVVWIARAGRVLGARGEMVLIVVLTALPAIPAALLVRIDLAPDTFEQTAAWLSDGWRSDARNRDPASGAIVTTAPLVLPVRSAPPPPDVKPGTLSTGAWPWLQYQSILDRAAPRAREYDLRMIPLDVVFRTGPEGDAELERWLDRAEAQYAIVELSPRTVGWPMTWRLRELVQRRGELVWSAAGESDEWRKLGPLGYQGNRAMPVRLCFASALGPQIEVYRLRR